MTTSQLVIISRVTFFSTHSPTWRKKCVLTWLSFISYSYGSTINSLFPNHVCRLTKAIYDLRQAPRTWYYSRLSSFLTLQGFHMSNCDSSLFILHSSTSIVVILVYVDDFLVTRSDTQYISKLLTTLNDQFAMRLLGPLKHFFGYRSYYHTFGFTLSQNACIQKLLKKAGMSSSKPASTPMIVKKCLLVVDPKYNDPHFYRSIVGAWQCVIITRPNLTFAVNTACQHMHKPLLSHVQALKCILHYLAGTSTLSLHYSLSSLHLQGYSDADWVGDLSDWKFTSRYCIYMGTKPIMWSSRKQSTISRSSTEAKYRALASNAVKICSLIMLLTELRLLLPSVPTVWCDNKSEISLTSFFVFHARFKHIEIDCHFIREKILKGVLFVKFSRVFYLCGIFRLNFNTLTF